jgi:hypothetical protein
MKKVSIVLVIVSFVLTSCNLTDLIPGLDTDEETSFTMEYDGVTYTEAAPLTLALVNGQMFVAGTEENGFLLSITGIGEDGTTTEICNGADICEEECSLMLTLEDEEDEIEEILIATSGTIKHTGNKIEIDVLWESELSETKTLTATIEIGTTLDL